MRFFRHDLPLEPQMPLFDVHVNVGMTDNTGLSYGRITPDVYRGLMDVTNTRYACVFPPLLERYDEANAHLLAWARLTEGRVLPFARLGGDYPVPAREFWQVRRRLKAAVIRPVGVTDSDLTGFAGVKLIPHLSGLPDDAMFERINALELPVLIHSGVHSPADWIEARVLPRMKGTVVLAHLGAFPADPAGLFAAVDLAKRVERVYLDTSGVWLAAFMDYAIQQVPHKLLFGSDAPMMHPLVAWQHLACVVKDDALLEAISYRTARELFGVAA